MLTQRPIGALIRIARARSNGGSISNAVRQIWALRAPVILLRAPALRRRHRPSPGGAGPGPARSSLNPRARTSSRRARRLSDVLARGARSRGPRPTAGEFVMVAVRQMALLLRRTRRRGLSKSVAKAPIAPKRRKRIVDIPRFFSPPIPPRGAFATDSDTPPPRIATGAPPAPARQRPATTNPSKDRRRPASGPSSLIIRVHRSEYRCPEPEYQAPGPGRRAAGEGSLRCRCRRHPASGSGGWSYRRRGRRR